MTMLDCFPGAVPQLFGDVARYLAAAVVGPLGEAEGAGHPPPARGHASPGRGGPLRRASVSSRYRSARCSPPYPPRGP
ncbi:hypothetical protein QC281_03105 [Streptomyces sp. DH17]|nr:hypothetical protein [Streptomyces sp. DH17]